MSAEKQIPSYLTLAEDDVKAADLLATASNRYAAYHVQQAIEKLLKAVLVERGIQPGLSTALTCCSTSSSPMTCGSPALDRSTTTRPTQRARANRSRADA